MMHYDRDGNCMLNAFQTFPKWRPCSHGPVRCAFSDGHRCADLSTLQTHGGRCPGALEDATRPEKAKDTGRAKLGLCAAFSYCRRHVDCSTDEWVKNNEKLVVCWNKME